MGRLEQENLELHKEVTTLRDSYERLIVMIKTPVAAQNQTPPPPQTPLQRTLISKIVSTPISVAPVSAPQHHMSYCFPWSMPPNFVPDGYQPAFEVHMAQLIMSVPPPVVHVVPYVEEPVFHVE